jgi:hypothetical protein
MEVLIQNSNTMEFVNFFENNPGLYIQIGADKLKMTVSKTMSKKKKI